MVTMSPAGGVQGVDIWAINVKTSRISTTLEVFLLIA
jgi:hypothetical protein